MIDLEQPHTGSRQDLKLFSLVFALGLVVLLLKLSAVPVIGLHIGVVVLMVAYAVITLRVPSLKLRADQAGDNAYYLGLLFTLISMAIALWQIGAGDNPAERLLPAFGVALTSTIFGVFLRVFLHQMRVDPVDVEEVARRELAEAASRLKGTLDTAVMTFANFPVEVSAQARDAIRAVVGDWQEVASEGGNVFRRELEIATGGVTAAARELQSAQAASVAGLAQLDRYVEECAAGLSAAVERLKAVETPPTRLAMSLERTARGVEAVNASLATARVGLEEVLSACRRTAEETTVVVAGLRDALSEARQREGHASQLYLEAMGRFDAGIRSAETRIGAGVEALATLAESAEETKRAHSRLRVASDEVIGGLSESVTSLSAAIKRLSDQVEPAVPGEENVG